MSRDVALQIHLGLGGSHNANCIKTFQRLALDGSEMLFMYSPVAMKMASISSFQWALFFRLVSI